MENNTLNKEEQLEKIIKLRNDFEKTKEQVVKTQEEIKKLNNEIELLKIEEREERRRLENKLKRSIWEVFNIATGNKKKVEELSHRVEDTKERFDKIDEMLTWIVRTIVGLLITTILGSLLRLLFNF